MIPRYPRLPFADTFGLFEPDCRDILFLRACLGNSAVASTAWTRWLEGGALPEALADRPRLRRLLPLLHHSLNRHGIAVSRDTLALLQAATLWEQRRGERIREILLEVLACLRAGGIRVLVMKGIVLAETVYPHARLRHCHDIDLLIDADDLPAADAALRAAGFVAVPGDVAAEEPSLLLQHRDGLPVSLHANPWDVPMRKNSLAGLYQRANALRIDQEPVLAMSPMDMLVHICTHPGVSTEAGSWVWIADAAMLLERYQPDPEAWVALVRFAADNGVALRFAIRLNSLVRIGIEIPQTALAALVAEAMRNWHEERDAALSILRKVAGVSRGKVLQHSGWRSRFEIVHWALQRRLGRLPAAS